jgi:hypothetical protein
VYGNLVDNSRNGEMLKRELKELFQFKFLNKISMEDEKFRESLHTVVITEPFKLTTKEYKLYSDHFMLGLLGKNKKKDGCGRFFFFVYKKEMKEIHLIIDMK